ncbi:isoleucyl-tRNA synthetase [Tieghemostelium lacteum]|uniref:isoleucine--tRNA ligase n=1 Tax=Tieghemostelium lacteum TaxID=361077 RepID=A0A151Z595_TIELA|nr:isoleucyl-tRNA synthetase [Tieghemostelium lacteum]|eukprot:KYQ89108.1 isoleucyl-tRNA synthetase [Tieghemostelium lacteum]
MQQVPQKISFPKEEEKVLDYWNQIKAFETSVKMSEGKPEYSFYDGPPFATGLPHYGHILTGTIKDTITRYAHQTGHHVERRFGWDCHGLPIEFEIDKLFGVKTKDDVLKMGIPKYNQECRNIVMRYSQEWNVTTKRLGRWIDTDNNYKTMDPTFMESVWWVFKRLYDKELVYQGFKVMPYSVGCTTPLSNFEAGQNYKDVNDPALVVAFPVVGDEQVSFLAWTTTPWTLPSNLALCVNPKMEYVKIQDIKRDKQFILAKTRTTILYKTEAEFKVLETYTGSQLVGKKYVPMFPYFAGDAATGGFSVISGDFVTDDSGTGIVHCAPAFGEEDFNACLAHKIISRDQYKRPILNTVDANGRFSDDVVEYKGQFVKDADKEITKAIKDKGRLVKADQIVHSYPFCWRSETPLIYKAVGSWFVKVESIRDRLVANNDTTYWVPEFVKEKRFTNWLLNACDWAISRNRYWGTPIPLWVSEDGEEVVAIGSVQELYEKSGVRITDLHRESIDHITIPSQKGKGVLRRIEEVFDCWFESGSMPYAQQHYPFENEDKFNKIFPADFIAEGIDQTRGWFYTLMVLSTALFDRAPFKNLICSGMVLAHDGKKMSKRLKNYPDPVEVINNYGSDALRLYLINSPVVKGDVLKFQEKGVQDMIKDVFLPWFNAYRFFVQNALKFASQQGKPFAPDFQVALGSENITDKWILAATQTLIKFVHEEMKAYRLYTVVPKLVKFIDQLTNWYVRLNRRRFKGANGEKDTLVSLNILYEVLMTICVAMAPFTPFFTDYMYQNLKNLLPADKQMGSVHFLPYPEPRESAFNVDIELAFSRMQTVIELGRQARDRRTKPLKYPLKELMVITENQHYLDNLDQLKTYILEELNLLNLNLTTNEGAFVTITADPDRKRIGQRLKDHAKKINPAIGKLTNDELRAFQKSGEIVIEGQVLTTEDIKLIRKFSGDTANCEPLGNNEILTVLDLTVDQVLLEKGFAREVLNRIQRLRKSSGLNAEDNVKMYFNTSSKELLTAINNNQEYLTSVLQFPIVESEKPTTDVFALEIATVVDTNDITIWFIK